MVKRATLVADMRRCAEKWRAEADRAWPHNPTSAAAYRVKSMTYARIADAYERYEEGYL